MPRALWWSKWGGAVSCNRGIPVHGIHDDNTEGNEAQLAIDEGCGRRSSVSLY